MKSSTTNDLTYISHLMLGLLGKDCFAETGTGGHGQRILYEDLVPAFLHAAPHDSLIASDLRDDAASAQKSLHTSPSFTVDRTFL